MKSRCILSYLSININLLKRLLSASALVLSTSVLVMNASYKDDASLEQIPEFTEIAEIDEQTASSAPVSSGYVAALETYTTGYVSPSGTEYSISSYDEELIENLEDIEPTSMYVDTGDWSKLNVRELPRTDADIITQLEPGSEVTVVDNINKVSDFVKIDIDGNVGYIHSDFISETEPEFPSGDITTAENITTEYNQDNNNLVLNSTLGTIQGPSGKETYYNRPMSGVVKIMHDMGIEGDYWVRDDGVKCLGDYIIVAANLSVYPRGSIVETSLGFGIVSDTGEFAKSNPTQLDIAVAW